MTATLALHFCCVSNGPLLCWCLNMAWEKPVSCQKELFPLSEKCSQVIPCCWHYPTWPCISLNQIIGESKTCFPHVNVMPHMTPSRITGRSLCSQKIPWPLGEDIHSMHGLIGGELRKTPHMIPFKTMEGKAIIMLKFMKGACLTFKLGISQCPKDLHTKFILSVLYLLKYIEILTGLPLSSTKENYI